MLLLKLGDEGPSVAAVQRALAAAGASVPVTGTFDRRTEDAVRGLQRSSGLAVDGIVGNGTIAALGLDWVTVDPGGFRAEIVRIAEREWRRWHVNGTALVETDPAMTAVLQGYYRVGVGRSVAARDLQSASWQQAHPWSAAFISWVMRIAGAGDRFAYASAHQRYIAAAKRNRLAGDRGNTLRAYRIDELAPAVGDLLCTARANSGATYENIDAGPRSCHVDIVVAAGSETLTAIGGNVGHSVGRKLLRTVVGLIDVTAERQHDYFAAIRIGGLHGPIATARPVIDPSTRRSP
jgi:hypothetical protein